MGIDEPVSCRSEDQREEMRPERDYCVCCMNRIQQSQCLITTGYGVFLRIGNKAVYLRPLEHRFDDFARPRILKSFCKVSGIVIGHDLFEREIACCVLLDQVWHYLRSVVSPL